LDTPIRVLLSTGAFFLSPLPNAFELAAEAGFDGVEVAVTQDRQTQSAESLRSLSEEFGLPIQVLHGPFLLLTRRVWGTDPRGKIARSVALATETGIPTVVIHPPYRWQVRYAHWLTKWVEYICLQERVVVAVENMYPVRLGSQAFRFHRWMDPDQLGRFPYLTLDTSHLAASGLDLIEAYDELRDRVVHIHLADNRGKGRDSHTPLGEGVLPVAGFLEHLSASGYLGAITLEIDVRPYLDDRARLLDLLKGNREFCAEHLEAGALRRH